MLFISIQMTCKFMIFFWKKLRNKKNEENRCGFRLQKNQTQKWSINQGYLGDGGGSDGCNASQSEYVRLIRYEEKH